MLTIFAYVIRLVRHLKRKGKKRSSYVALDFQKKEKALKLIGKTIQNFDIGREIKEMQRSNELRSSSHLTGISLFFDDHRDLRLGGWRAYHNFS